MKNRLSKTRLIFKWLWRLVLVTILLLSLLVAIVYWKQDQIVQKLLTYANAQYTGKITLEGSHISPFANFPYISIDLEQVKIHETKQEEQKPILAIQDVYLGFDLWTIISGNYQLKSVYLSDGYIKFIQHKDGSFNIVNALSSKAAKTNTQSVEDAPFQLELNAIKLHNIDIHKVNEANDIDLDAFVDDAVAQLSINGEHIMIDLDSRFEMNLMQAGDTTFIKRKHFDVQTKLDFDSEKSLLTMASSAVKLEMGEFNLEGQFDIANDQYLDLKVEGAKPNFDLIIAFAPEELIPTLRSYDNKGKVYFKATVQGNISHGNIPLIDAEFGCEEGMIKNTQNNKELDEMQFKGYFRNTSNAESLQHMEFGLEDFKAKPESGQFYADLKVKNFSAPDIDLKLRSQFNLTFLTAFLNLRGFSDMSGTVDLTMNFHDIIDLDHPEKTISKLNESYFTKLEVRNLNFRSAAFYLPIQDINLIGHIEGHEAQIDTFRGKIGQSDVFATGKISDLPAILHHTKDSVSIDMKIRSKLLNLTELTFNDSIKASAIDEQIKDFELDVSFASSAYAFTESPNLPRGEFFVRNLHATLQHYPHELHDFSADIYIEDEDIRLIDFSGELDQSDFHFSGRLAHYDIWMNQVIDGDTNLEFDLTSKQLRLKDLMVYKGENYVPEDYRHEYFEGLKLHGRTELHFKSNQLHSIDLYLDQLACKMKVHQCRFERFNGRLHYEDQHLVTKDLKGQIGRSDFALDLYWYLGKDSTLRQKDHLISLRSQRLDINQLLEWNPTPNSSTTQSVDHDSVLSIFDIPFWDMRLNVDIANLSYHQYVIQNFKSVLRMASNRYLYIDTCQMNIAGGNFDINGYFNASNPEEIYFSPEIYAQNIDIDQFMLKFDNFGQDYVVSDNLHGIIDCDLAGKLHIHKDLTPMLDKSNFIIDLQVLNGRLENYKPIEYIAEYFKDKNLQNIRFDTLQNTFEYKDQKLIIPEMTINTSLGFIELWGEQNLGRNRDMDLFVKVPLKIITKAVFQKLFKRKQEEVNLAQEDAIEYQDKDKKIAYVHVHLQVTQDGYSVKLQRDRDKLREERKKRRAERKAERKKKREERRSKQN